MQVHVKDLKRRASAALSGRKEQLRHGTAALRRMRLRRGSKA